MESYEKIKKMAEISKELKKHGLATTSDEALKQAEDIVLSGKKSDLYVNTEESKENVEKMQNKTMKNNSVEQDMRKITNLVNDKLNSMNADISLIRSKMNEIIAKINDIESKIEAQPKQEVQAKLNVDEKPAIKPEPKPNQVQPEVKDNYNPDDVAIDKMFYMGKK